MNLKENVIFSVINNIICIINIIIFSKIYKSIFFNIINSINLKNIIIFGFINNIIY